MPQPQVQPRPDDSPLQYVAVKTSPVVHPGAAADITSRSHQQRPRTTDPALPVGNIARHPPKVILRSLSWIRSGERRLFVFEADGPDLGAQAEAFMGGCPCSRVMRAHKMLA